MIKLRKFSSSSSVIAAGFYSTAAAYGTLNSFGVFLKPMLFEFGWSRSITSGVFFLNMLVQGLTIPVWGRVTTLYGVRRAVSVGGFLLGMGLLLCTGIRAIWHFYLFYGVLVGIGTAAFFVPISSFITREFVKRRGLILGIVNSGIGIGTLCISTLAGVLIATYGWRISFAALMIVGWSIIFVSPFLRHFPKAGDEVNVQESKKSSSVLRRHSNSVVSDALRQALRNKFFWIFFGSFSFYGFAHDMVMVHLVPFATDARIPLVFATLALSSIGGCSVLGRVLMGAFSDLFGRSRTLLLCLGMQSSLLIWLILVNDVWMLYTFAILYGFAYGGSIAQYPTIAGESFQVEYMSEIFGVATLGATVMGGLGAVTGGYLFDLTNSYFLPFSLAIAAYFLSILCVCLLERGTAKHPI